MAGWPPRFDRKITLQRVTETRSASGDVVETWATLAEVWSNYRPLRGDEFFSADMDVAERQAAFIIRHRTDVNNKDRISFEDRIWIIKHIAEIGRRDGLEIRAAAQGN